MANFDEMAITLFVMEYIRKNEHLNNVRQIKNIGRSY